MALYTEAELREQLRLVRQAKADIGNFPHPELLPYRRALLERDEERITCALRRLKAVPAVRRRWR